MSGLRSTASAGQSGETDWFESHLYSHSYPAYTYHLRDDVYLENFDANGNWIKTSILEVPLNWEEQMSTASLGISGQDTRLGISRWDEASGKWSLIKECSPAEGEAKTFRATDVITDWDEYEMKITGIYQHPFWGFLNVYEWVPTGSTKKEEGLWEGTERVREPEEQVPWGIKYMYNNPDLTRTSGGRGVDVAVLDSGADIFHPDLTMRIEDYFDIYYKIYNSEKGIFSDASHGTHVSGTIAADGGFDGKGIYGMAPEADLHEYKVLGIFGGLDEEIALGMYRAADLGSDIISMSLGGWYYPGTTDDFTKRAGDYAVANDVLVVAAAGNGLPYYPTIMNPAKNDGVVAVGAIDEAGRSVWWSSPGFNGYDGLEEYVIFAAPGNLVLSTIPTNAEYDISQDADGIYQYAENFPWYAYWAGTSMATPHISGTAAKILADGLYNGMGISQSNSDYVKSIMQGYARDHPVIEANLKNRLSDNAEDYAGDIAYMADEAAGYPPGDYYSALLDAIAKGDDTMVIPGDSHNNCLAGHGVPRLPEGST